MNPASGDRPQQARTFTGNLRHVARRPLLGAWLGALAVLAGVVQVQVSQPWAGLLCLVIMSVVVISVGRSLERSHADEGDPAEG
ncbi:hypothetical protein ABZX98_27830 [Streptomyces sp. NPDC002992]|uniref:hypothetical protein n=1 Tax=Streptomyces sp. NPDC002992 TaxID=3154273 RepID=UPI0033BAD0CF